MLRDELLLLAVRFFGELLRVAAGALALLAELDLEEFRTEALDLLLHDRPGIERLDHRAEPAGRRDGLQARDAGSEHEDARRGDRPRGRGQHGEELRQRVRRDDDGLVAGDVALRRQRVHRLRPRDARDRVHAEGGGPLGRQRAHGVRVRERLDGRDERRAVAQEADLVGRRLLHLDHQVGGEGRVAIRDRRAGVPVGLVVVPAPGPRAGLDDDLGPRLRQLRHRVRHERDPPFAGHGLSRHSDLHLMTKS